MRATRASWKKHEKGEKGRLHQLFEPICRPRTQVLQLKDMWKWLLLALLWPALGQDEEEPVDIISAKQLRELHTKFDTNKDGKVGGGI